MTKSCGFVIGIDASRNRSGGAKAHLIGILSNLDPRKHNIRKVHVWAYRSLLDQLPSHQWLIKHNPIDLEQSLLRQLIWQGTKLASEVKLAGCDILLGTCANTVCRFKPMVAISQDMLSYEPGIMGYFGYSRARLRLLTILFLQNLTFRYSDGVIFLTRYAAKVIQNSCKLLPNIAFVPHGIDASFKQQEVLRSWPVKGERPIRCIYVSNSDMYKNQWVVVEAISLLRKRGHDLILTLVGGGAGPAQEMLNSAISMFDPRGNYVEQLPFLSHDLLPALLADSNLFIFASSCENMPITLLEAMAVGLPIACSNRGPMPEVLADGGVYFDPEDSHSIALAVEEIIQSPELRVTIAKQAKSISQQYNWSRCSNETFSFVINTYLRSKI